MRRFGCGLHLKAVDIRWKNFSLAIDLSVPKARMPGIA